MKRAFILIGASGSGKSTVSARLIQKYWDSDISSFSLDDCRTKFYLENAANIPSGMTIREIYGKAFDFCNEKKGEFEKFVKKSWAEARESHIVIVDNVNGTRKSRAQWVADLQKDKFHITMIQMQTPLNVILERQQTRGDKSVPENIVRQMYMRQEEAMMGTECDSILVIDGTRPIDSQL